MHEDDGRSPAVDVAGQLHTVVDGDSMNPSLLYSMAASLRWRYRLCTEG